MSPKFAWTSVLATLHLLAGQPARAELPGVADFRERMAPATAAQTVPPVVGVVEVTSRQKAATRPTLPHLSSHYGSRIDPIDGGQRFHAGIDIPAASGSPVLASATGIVTFSGTAGGYGRMVEIDHGNGLRTRYAHLDRTLVWPGARVEQGALVGRIGSTGRSTGPHLHFEVRQNGRPKDPVRFLTGVHAERPKKRDASRIVAASEPHISEFAKARAKAAQETGN